MNRNGTKKLLLEVAEDFNEPAEAALFQTWAEMTYNTSLSDKGVRMGLLRAHRQGLLSRRNGKYSLTEKGSLRLQFFRSSAQ
jgi:DNA-binding transcriptional regulator PaaX